MSHFTLANNKVWIIELYGACVSFLSSMIILEAYYLGNLFANTFRI